MKVSFTGTREGMTDEQKQTFAKLLKKLNCTLLIHGDCKGADKHAHDIAIENGLDSENIHLRPCNLKKWRAKCDGKVIAKPKDPLDRNKEIVADGEILIGTPATEYELYRGGTWYTLHHARDEELPYIIIWPSGEYEVHNYELN
jgi:hypothetical protein